MSSSIEELQKDLKIVIQCTSIASVLMSSIVLGFFICVKKLRQFEFLMICMVSLGNLIASLALGIAVSLPTISPLSCAVQGFFKSFGSLMSLAWTVNIAYTMRLSIMSLSPEQIKQRQNIMFSMGIIGPFILSLLPFINNSYEVSQRPLSDTICYIVGVNGINTYLDDILIFLCFQIPLIITFIFNLDCMNMVIKEYKRLLGDNKVIDKISRLILFPFILVTCWGSFLAWNIMILIVVKPQYYIFEIICFGTSNLSGFLDGLAYGMITAVQICRQDKELAETESILLIRGGESTLVELNSQTTSQFNSNSDN